MSDAGRKRTFTKKLLEQVALIPGCAKSYRSYLERTALLCVDGLARLGFLKYHPDRLNSEAISKLVHLWQSQNMAQKTLANRLAAIRKIANTTTPPLFVVPSNQTFKISLPAKRKVLTDAAPKLNPYDIQNPSMRTACLLQLLFGLAKVPKFPTFWALELPFFTEQ